MKIDVEGVERNLGRSQRDFEKLSAESVNGGVS